MLSSGPVVDATARQRRSGDRLPPGSLTCNSNNHAQLKGLLGQVIEDIQEVLENAVERSLF